MSPRSRIVAGIDGSPGGRAAARLAAAEAVSGDCVLRLVHAQLPRSAYAYLAPPGRVDDAAVEARRLVVAAADELRLAYPGLTVQGVVSTMSPGSAIVRAARSAVLVVVGRGRHDPAGGVARHVMAYGSCPVMVVGGTVAEPAGAPVVLGLDPDDIDDEAVRFAFGAAARRGGGLRVCHVRRPECGPDDDEVRAVLSEALAPWRRDWPDVPVAVEVLAGIDPAAQLLDTSADAGLVIVTGRGGLPGVLVRNAGCPVAVVPAGRRA